MILGKYNQAKTIYFSLYEIDGIDLSIAATFAAGDIKIMKDEGAEANTTNLPTDEGQGYSLVLTAAEMSAARLKIYIVDQTATKVWLDTTVALESYGNASAEHAFDLDTATASADVVSISGDTTAADNLELMYDGTGYTDDTAPASRTQVDGIGASSGGSLAFQNEADNVGAPIKSVTFDGVETSGTNASVFFNDGTYHNIDDTANNIDIVYQFDIGGGRTGVEIVWIGYLQGGNDVATLQAYNGSTWDTLGTISGKSGTANDTFTRALFSAHTGAGADLGKVFIRIECAAQSNPSLFTDQLIVEAVNIGQSVGYANGQVSIDTVSGVAGTESFVNGVADNPTDLMASGFTIAAAVGLADFHIINGSSITFAQSTTNKSYFGDNWSLVLGGQDVAGCYIQGAFVSGTGVAATEVHFEGCEVNGTSVGVGHFDYCGIVGTITMTTAGSYKYHNCYSAVAGASSPIITKTAGQTITAEYRNWAGGLTQSGIQSGDVFTIGGILGTITLNGADGTVEIRGTYKAVVDNRTGSPVLNLDGAIKGSDVADILTDTSTTLDGKIDDIQGATFNTSTDSLEAIRDRGDAAWTGGGGSGGGVGTMLSATVSKDGTSQILQFPAYDSSSTVGDKLAGLVFNTASLKAYYNRTGAAGAATAITLVTATKGTWVTGGFIAVDATNQTGEYELHIPDAALATGADRVIITLEGAANMAPVNITLDLVEEIDLGTDNRVLVSANAHTSGETVADVVTLTTFGLDHLVSAAVVGADVADDSIFAKLVSASGTADWDDFVNTTDALQAIRDRGDAAWTTGAGGSDRLLMVDTTIATLASQTSFTLTAGSTDDDAYNGLTLVAEDVATATQKAVGTVIDYVGSTKTVTLKEALSFTLATTDKIYVLAADALKPTVPNRYLDVTATGAGGIDWANVENPTTTLNLSNTDINTANIVDSVWDEDIVAAHSTVDTAGLILSSTTSLSSGAGGISAVATSATVTTGTETLTYTSTGELDGTTHDIAASAGNTEFYYELSVGVSGVATQVLWDGHAESNGDSYDVKAFDWVSSTYKGVGTISASNSTAMVQEIFVLTNAMTGTGANAGIVRWQITSADGTNFSTDRVLVTYTSLPAAADIFASGVAQSGGNNAIQLASGDVIYDDQFVRSKVIITSGTGAGQEVIVTSSVASTDTLTTTPTWGVNPDSTSVYNLVPGQAHETVRNGGYDNGAIYIDSNGSGSAGTEKGVNGTTSNKSSNSSDI